METRRHGDTETETETETETVTETETETEIDTETDTDTDTDTDIDTRKPGLLSTHWPPCSTFFCSGSKSDAQIHAQTFFLAADGQRDSTPQTHTNTII